MESIINYYNVPGLCVMRHNNIHFEFVFSDIYLLKTCATRLAARKNNDLIECVKGNAYPVSSN